MPGAEFVPVIATLESVDAVMLRKLVLRACRPAQRVRLE